MKREKCVICDSTELICFLDYTMPVYSGAIDDDADYNYHPMVFSECNQCRTVQLSELVDPNLVYMIDHNSLVVGEIWKSHYNEFSEFIGDVSEKTVLELSDPSAKIAKLCKNYKKWYIVEPNSYLDDTEKITFINKFFDEKFTIDDKVDLIVHSHFFEHTYEPKLILENSHRLLEDGGMMYFSVPNLDFLLNNGYQPNNILHFEHTFYFDIDRLSFLLNTTGFEILEIKEFRNHSLFFKCKKTEFNLDLKTDFVEIKSKFQLSFDKYQNLIKKINQVSSDYDQIVLFGCHMSSQFLLSNGLNQYVIDFIVDNAQNKQNKYLYGFDLQTKSPSEIKDDKKVLVILSHSGVYFSEIKQSLESLNKNLTFI